jgi:hypothetical protein
MVPGASGVPRPVALGEARLELLDPLQVRLGADGLEQRGCPHQVIPGGVPLAGFDPVSCALLVEFCFCQPVAELARQFECALLAVELHASNARTGARGL